MPARDLPSGASIPLSPLSGRPNWTLVLCGAVLVLGTLAAYCRTFSSPLVFDDNIAVVGNATIHQWGTAIWPQANSPLSSRPFLNLTFAANYWVSKEAVWSYHVANLAIHILAGLTLFAATRRTLLLPVLAGRFGDYATLLALTIGAIWLWHPLQTESVTYVSQRAESLAGLFYLLTLYCFIRGSNRCDARGRVVWFTLSVSACLFGVATKEVIVTAPIMVLLYDRTFLSGSFSKALQRHRALYLALAATWIPLGCLMARLQGQSIGFGKGVEWWAYGLTECRVIVRYFLLALWPSPLVFDYGMGVVTQLSKVWPYMLILVALLVVTAVAFRRSSPAGFALCWFFLILAPTSSIVPVVGQPMAENRLYLPLAGIAAFAVLGAFALFRRWSIPVLGGIAACLCIDSALRNQDYASDYSIWSDTANKQPQNERAHYNLGVSLSLIPGRSNDEIAEYLEAIRIKPDYAEARNNLGLALSRIPGRQSDAIEQYEEALRIKPNYAAAHINLGVALSGMRGRSAEAIAHYEEAIRLKPDSAEARNDLGLVLSHDPRRLNDAIAEYEGALRLNPGFVAAHINLGVAFAQTGGRMNEAVSQFEEALRLAPDSAEAHNDLGLALTDVPGRLHDAHKQFQEAVRLDPNSASGWYGLGACLFHLGDLAAAADAFRNELRISPNDPAAQRALAEVLRQRDETPASH